MGFYDKFAYELFPIPFTKQNRNSLKVENENESRPLSAQNYIIPTVFLIGGYLISFIAFLIEKFRGKPKHYVDY